MSTLALPISGADDGKFLFIINITGNQSTVTTPANGLNGAGGGTVITFDAGVGMCMLVAQGGTWWVASQADAVNQRFQIA